MLKTPRRRLPNTLEAPPFTSLIQSALTQSALIQAAGRRCTTIALFATSLLWSAVDARPATINVSSTAWGNDGDAATCTLWEAVKSAKTAADFGGCMWGGDATIDLQPSTHYTTQAQLPDIDTSVTILGNGATLERDPLAPAARFFRVFGANTSLNLVDLTLTGGSADKGGAIWLWVGATLDGHRLRLEGNDATLAGGAIYSRGQVDLLYATLVGNSATNGGAISADLGRIEIVNSTFAANQASHRGGAILAWPNVAQLVVRKSTFSANEAFRGGALFRAGEAWPDPDSIEQTTFMDNGVTGQGAGGTLFFVGPNHLTLSKSALHGGESADALCAGDLTCLVSAGHNAATDASCALDHVEDYPAVAFSLSGLVNHGGFTEVHVPRCDQSPVGYDCSILMDQYECDQAEQDQREVQRDRGGAFLGDMEGLCDIGSYESICHASQLSPNPAAGTASFLTLLSTDQMKRDGTVLNSGACSGVGEAWAFPEEASNCQVSWQIAWGAAQPLDFVAIWFLDDSQPCPHDCFTDPEDCKINCTQDPNNWKASLPGLGFDVPTWETPPDNTFITLVSSACELPRTRYVMEFANGVVPFWDPEVKITSGEPPAANGNTNN